MSIVRQHNRFRGVLLTTDKETGRTTGRELLTCCHCLFTWSPVKGSGRLIGFCQNCAGFVCGRPSCVATGCLHHEAQLENIEAGRPIDHKRIIVRGS